jgi:hypothetical protein
VSAPKIDLEKIVDSLVAILKAHLNTQIAAISSEKNDGLNMESVFNSAYALLDLNTQPMTWDPFVVILVDDIRTQGQGPMSAHIVSLLVLLVKEDQGTDSDIHRKMLRYLRAVEETVEGNFSDLSVNTKYEVQSLAPQRLKLLNSSKPYRGTGVAVTFSYTS